MHCGVNFPALHRLACEPAGDLCDAGCGARVRGYGESVMGPDRYDLGSFMVIVSLRGYVCHEKAPWTKGVLERSPKLKGGEAGLARSIA